MDAGSRRGLPTAPPPLGHLGWSWQHQVDQSWLMGRRKVARQAMVWFVEARGEAGGAWGPHLPGSPWVAPPLSVCWAPTRFPAGQASVASPSACTQRSGMVSPLLGGPRSPPCHLKNGDGQTLFLPQD